MSSTSFCSSTESYSQSRLKFKKRKLSVLLGLRDSLERRLSALDASISTLRSQIDRDAELIDPET